MKKVSAVVIGAVLVIIFWFLTSSISNKNAAQIQTQTTPYETSVFSVQFPSDGHVKVTISNGNGLHAYNSTLPNRNQLAVLYFDSERPDLRIDNSMQGVPGFLDDILQPGYSTKRIDGKTIGGLPAWEFIASGIEKSSSEPHRCHTRLAISADGIRHWMLWECSFNENEKSLEADSKNFFDSFKIK
jgi:hypothetical protein